jgi:hypothetical protein
MMPDPERTSTESFLFYKKSVSHTVTAPVRARGVFVTTPNRWFPVEFHTMLALIHWLPILLHRKMLIALDCAFFVIKTTLTCNHTEVSRDSRRLRV